MKAQHQFTADGSSKIIASDTLADEGSDDILKAI